MGSKKALETVKVFYDTFGWKKDLSYCQYHDQLLFVETDKTTQDYIKCNEERYHKYFKNGGQFFLDAGCGALPRFNFSKNYKKHVCVDISMTGLMEARGILGDKGLYIKADLAELPFMDESFDGILVSHCLYHVAKKLQSVALGELYRVTKVNKNMLIFYSSNYNLLSLFSNIGKQLTNLLNLISQISKSSKPAANENNQNLPQLYSYTFNPFHLTKEFKSAKISCLRILTQTEMKFLRKIHLLKFTLPVFAFLERTFSFLMCYVGRYVAIRIEKERIS